MRIAVCEAEEALPSLYRSRVSRFLGKCRKKKEESKSRKQKAESKAESNYLKRPGGRR